MHEGIEQGVQALEGRLDRAMWQGAGGLHEPAGRGEGCSARRRRAARMRERQRSSPQESQQESIHCANRGNATCAGGRQVGARCGVNLRHTPALMARDAPRHEAHISPRHWRSLRECTLNFERALPRAAGRWQRPENEGSGTRLTGNRREEPREEPKEAVSVGTMGSRKARIGKGVAQPE